MESGYITHAVATVAFVGLALTAHRRRVYVPAGTAVVAAATVNALWAAVVTYEIWNTPSEPGTVAYGAAEQLLEIARSGAWLVASALVLRSTAVGNERLPLVGALSAIGAALAIVVTAPPLQHFGVLGAVFPSAVIAAFLCLAVVGLALTENVYRNTPAATRWHVKFFCLGTGAIFIYDFVLFSQGLLFRQISADLFVARGITNAIAVPLLILWLIRAHRPASAIAVSRRVAFHSAAVIGAGIYLLLMAAAGYYIREFGGTWGGVLQAAFLFGAVLLLLISIFSGTFRAWLRIAVEKNFFKYKYDYREEWLRLIATISSSSGAGRLRDRVVEGVANIVDSPDGGLWLHEQGGGFRLVGRWNLSRWHLADDQVKVEADAALPAFLERTGWVIDLGELRTRPDRYEGLPLPDWLAALERPWLIVPLSDETALVGFVVLGQPRAPRTLNWEDFDLLKTAARQAASYLAEEAATRALADARQFDEFNRRFAFVVHDIKNLVSQLSLLVSNAAKHRHDATFQDDMLLTIRESVEKMRRMLSQLHGQQVAPSNTRSIEISRVLRQAVEVCAAGAPKIELDVRANGIAVVANEDRLRAVIGHLVQNAIEAVDESREGRVKVRLSSEQGMAIVEVEDNGPGMSNDFVRDELFRPFRSTKGGGYGIGAFESREFARALGGRLEVISEPGRGTVMRMSLPAQMST